MNHFFQITPFFIFLIFPGLKKYCQTFPLKKFESLDRTSSVKFADSKEETNSHFEIERSINGVRNFEKIGGFPSSGFNGDEDIFLAGGPVYYQIRPVDFFGYSTTSINDY